MELKVCSSIGECKEFVENKLNELEREAEIVAGVLESIDEKAASFEDLKKVLGGEMADAFYRVEKGSVKVFVQPNPVLMKDELKRRAEELAKLIEIFRQLSEIMSKLYEGLGDVQGSVLISADEQGGKLFISLG